MNKTLPLLPALKQGTLSRHTKEHANLGTRKPCPAATWQQAAALLYATQTAPPITEEHVKCTNRRTTALLESCCNART